MIFDYSIKEALFFATHINKYLSYHRETALQGGLVMTWSGRLELGDNILRSL